MSGRYDFLTTPSGLAVMLVASGVLSALLSRPDVQSALMALGEGRSASVRIEKDQVQLILEHGLDDFRLARHLDALADVAKALHLALAPARDGVPRSA